MGRKAKSEKKKIRTLGASVVRPFADTITAYCAQKERSLGWFSGRLMLRGYIAFLYDGLFEAEDVKDEAINKGLRPDQLAIIEAQLKIDSAAQEIPATNNTPKKPYIPISSSGEAKASKKGGRK